MKLSKKSEAEWYNERKWAAILAAATLLAAYAIGSRALYTGSLQQYFIMIVLVIFCINRLAHILIGVFSRDNA